MEARNSQTGAKPFSDIVDFVRRVSTRKVNKKVLEALTLSGALDSISNVNRPTILASIENLLEYASSEQEERELGQSSLFDDFKADEIRSVKPESQIFLQFQ